MATSQLPVRKLGKNGPQVTAIGYGTMGLSTAYGKVKPDGERLALLDKAYELGEWHWDTADVYGDAEDLLGKWFAANPEKRKDIFLATKFGGKLENGQFVIDSTPEYAKQALERSLKRLGLPYVDLYYVHRVDLETPVEKTIRALAELQAEGKIKHIGISEVSAATLRRASKIHHVDALQVEYSPWALDIETDQIGLLKAARELGTAIVAYSPIGRGFLTGTIRSRDDFEADDFRRFAPRFSEENFPKNLAVVAKLEEFAKDKNVTPSQLALAWILAQGDDIFPIPGTTNAARLRENIEASNVNLSASELDAIRKIVDEAEVHGARYPEGFQKNLFGDTPEE